MRQSPLAFLSEICSLRRMETKAYHENTKARERALTKSLPNLLTYARILAVPGIVACFFLGTPIGNWIAFVLFIAASITDYLDGYLARVWSQQSALGRMLDPIADKLLVAASLLSLCAFNVISSWSIWAAIIILFREIAVSGLREFLAGLQVSVPVSTLAKWKTALQMTAIAVLLIGPAYAETLPLVTTIGLTLLWIAALVTLVTGYDYFRAGLRHLLEDDA